MPVEVVDDPAACRAGLHEAQELVELVVGHVMGDEAGDDKIERAGDIMIVAGAIFDRPFDRRRRPGRDRAACIEIDADQVGGQVLLPGPPRDPAQHVAMAEADVEQPE